MIVAVPVLADESSMNGKLSRTKTDKMNVAGGNELRKSGRFHPAENRQDQGRNFTGTDVYTNDELRTLNRELEEAVKTWKLKPWQLISGCRASRLYSTKRVAW